MIEELKIVLSMLDGVAEIGSWVVGGYLVFKAIILLSTTGATVYLTGMAIKSLSVLITKHLDTSRETEKDKILAAKTKPDIVIDQMCINADAYAGLIATLKSIPIHTESGTKDQYFWSSDAKWLKDAVYAKMAKDNFKKEDSK